MPVFFSSFNDSASVFLTDVKDHFTICLFHSTVYNLLANIKFSPDPQKPIAEKHVWQQSIERLLIFKGLKVRIWGIKKNFEIKFLKYE